MSEVSKTTIITLSFIIVSVLSLTLSAGSVHALGITPSKTIIEYDTEEHMIPVRIINNNGQDMKLSITASGELAQYITIYTPAIGMESTEGEKEFFYSITLPSTISPGTKTSNIIISEMADAGSPNAISGMISVAYQLQVNVPYSGTYAEGYMSVSSGMENEFSTATLNVVNRGDRMIRYLNATLNVRDAGNNVVYSKYTAGYAEMFPGDSMKIEESFYLNKAGTYSAEYDLYYDGKNFIMQKDFDVGKYNITLMSTKVDTFKLGTIAKFDIDVSSNWNRPIDDFYAEVTVRDTDGKIIRATNITKASVNPGRNSLAAYLDTANLASGRYIIGIKLYAGKTITVKEYPSLIEANKIVIGVSEEKGRIIDKNLAIIITLAVISVFVLLAWLKKDSRANRGNRNR